MIYNKVSQEYSKYPPFELGLNFKLKGLHPTKGFCPSIFPYEQTVGSKSWISTPWDRWIKNRFERFLQAERSSTMWSRGQFFGNEKTTPVVVYLVATQTFFMFNPTWGNDPIWRAYFSKGLKPPTSCFPRFGKCGQIWWKNQGKTVFFFLFFFSGIELRSYMMTIWGF